MHFEAEIFNLSTSVQLFHLSPHLVAWLWEVPCASSGGMVCIARKLVVVVLWRTPGLEVRKWQCTEQGTNLAMGAGFGRPQHHAEWKGFGGPRTQTIQTEKACRSRKAGRVWRPSAVKAGYGGPRDEIRKSGYRKEHGRVPGPQWAPAGGP